MRSPRPGVAPENSSTAPAPNTAIATACGVTAISQVLASRKIRPIWSGAPTTSCAPSKAQRERERSQVVDRAIREQGAEQRSRGTTTNNSSSTDSKTPTPPGTVLMTPAAIAMM
jgi:hypothetical protein